MAVQWMLSLVLLGAVPLSLSQPCSRGCADDCDPDCSSVLPGGCVIPLENGEFTEIVDPNPNRRSCYRTCISQDPFGLNVSMCQVNRTAFENNRLVRQRGPRDQNAYSHFRIFSPGRGRNLNYRGNALCRFHLLCNTEGVHKDAILTVTLQTHDLEEPQAPCGEGESQCVDSVKMSLFGRTCTMCGTQPLRCREQPDFPTLPSMILLSGQRSLLLQFKSNRVQETTGFEFLTQCVEKSYYNSPGCSIPDPANARRRRDDVADHFPWQPHRMRRSGRVTKVIVPTDAMVVYKDYSVQVIRGTEWLYKFQNTRYFQVYNIIEGYQTYYQSAPEGREFPGFGILKIGMGIVQYVQTEVEPQFIPSPEEARITANLYRRIVSEIDQPDVDTTDIYDEGPRGVFEPITPTPEEIAEYNREAVMFGNACNGVLRATACLYQALFLEGGPRSSDCDP